MLFKSDVERNIQNNPIRCAGNTRGQRVSITAQICAIAKSELIHLQGAGIH